MRAGNISLMYVIATTVIDERPTPVSKRVAKSDGTSQANALSNEKPEYQIVVRISARLRPTRSENHPPAVEPMNMPTNDADVMKLMVSMLRCHACRTPGAANAKLFRSPSSKKKMYA